VLSGGAQLLRRKKVYLRQWNKGSSRVKGRGGKLNIAAVLLLGGLSRDLQRRIGYGKMYGGIQLLRKGKDWENDVIIFGGTGHNRGGGGMS